MSRYADNTTVSPERSLVEMQQVLERYGASQFAFIKNTQGTAVAFEYQGRRVRFSVALPILEDFNRTERGRSRKATSVRAAYEQAQRQRFRALLLVIKSKLESVESGIETFDEAFMAQELLPSGQTMGDWAKPQMEQMLATGHMPPLLLTEGR